MIKKFTLAHLILLFSMCLFYACQTGNKNNEIGNSTDSSLYNTNKQTNLHDSKLRSKEKIQANKSYLDTVQYIGFEDGGDQPLIFVSPLASKDTIGLITSSDNPEFVRGDEIEIEWKIDSIRYAGDPEFLNYTEYLNTAKVLKPLALVDKKVKFLWRENKFDKQLKADVNTLVLDETYLKTISDPEKAAIAFVASFIGNECAWDGAANESRSNLKCKILWALDLGYQCSSRHLGFLQYWLRNNPQLIKDLENCSTMPDGATVQDTFDEINVEVKDNIITIAFKASGFNLREQKGWNWTENIQFQFKKNELILLNKEVSPKKFTSIQVTE